MHFLQILYFTAEMEKVHAMESVAVLVKYLDASIAFTIFLLPPSTKLGEGYIFTGICDSVSGRTQVLYKAHVLYCALFSRSCFFSLEIAKMCFFVLYFLKNVLYFCELFKWVEFLFQVFIYNTKIDEL